MKATPGKFAIGLAVLAFAIALPREASAQATYDSAKAELQKRLDAARTAAATNPDLKVWDFVVADRNAKRVTIFACGTNIRTTDPVEFFVTPLASGKDYESLAVTFAKPSDVRAAMTFAGIQPGQPVDFEKNRYWPRGPRVVMNYLIAGKPVRAEAMLVDTNTQKPLATTGLVYTGSYTYTDEAGKTHVAADDSDGRPIAPTYNDPAALFDVPAQAPQSQVYGFRKPSAEWAVKPGQPVDITLSEASGDAAVTELELFISAKADGGRVRYLEAVTWDGNRPIEAAVEQFDDLPQLIAKLAELADGKRDLFTKVKIGPEVMVRDARNLYGVLQAVEKDRGVKLLPPDDKDDLFHRSFFPQPEWRDRENRLGEPWELFLSRKDGTLSAKLERVTENPDRTAVERKVVESVTPADPAAIAKHVTDNASRWSRAIFVYPPADLTYGELLTWVRPVMATYPRIFVFPADAATTQPGR